MDFQVSRTLLGPKVWMAQLSGPNVFPFLVETFPVFSLNFFPFWGVWFLERATTNTSEKDRKLSQYMYHSIMYLLSKSPSKWHHLHSKPAFQTKVVCFSSMFLPVSQRLRLIPSKLSNCPSHGCPLSSCSAPEVTKWCFFRELTWGPHGTTIVDLEKEKTIMNLTHSKTPIKGQSQPFLNYAL